jgi:hypothetical protein
MKTITTWPTVVSPTPLLMNRINLQTTRLIRVIKSRRMRWAGHAARMGERRNTYKILVGNPEGRRPLEDQDVDGWTILKWILER